MAVVAPTWDSEEFAMARRGVANVWSQAGPTAELCGHLVHSSQAPAASTDTGFLIDSSSHVSVAAAVPSPSAEAAPTLSADSSATGHCNGRP